MSKTSIKVKDEEITELCENILCDIDYDMYKEDMMDGLGLVEGIEAKLRHFLENVEVVYGD